jgi:hypothetical protein
MGDSVSRFAPNGARNVIVGLAGYKQFVTPGLSFQQTPMWAGRPRSQPSRPEC